MERNNLGSSIADFGYSRLSKYLSKNNIPTWAGLPKWMKAKMKNRKRVCRKFAKQYAMQLLYTYSYSRQ